MTKHATFPLKSSLWRLFGLALCLAAQGAAAGQASDAAPRVDAESLAKKANNFPRRVVTMGPSLTETVFALGLGDRVVGVSDFCFYPPEATKLPRCGGAVNPRLEILAGLRPDLIVMLGEYEDLDDYCERRGIGTLHARMEGVESVKRDIGVMGRALGAPERATSLCRDIDRQLDALRVDLPEAKRTPVFICMWRQENGLGSLGTLGGGTLIDELVTLVGGRNVFADVKQPYPQASKEALLARRPEVIIEMRPGEDLTEARKRDLREDWDALGALPAVKNGRIRFITEDYILIPGPRFPLVAKAIREKLEINAKAQRREE